MEMSCDEAVIQKLPGQTADYSQALLRFSAGRAVSARALVAFAETTTARRIRNLSVWKQPKRAVALLTALACTLMIVGCAMDPTEATSDVEVVPISGPKAEVLVDVEAENYDYTEEIYFSMPEYPGVQFYRKGSAVYVQEADGWRRIMASEGQCIYLADLNDDGKREFCGEGRSGSGMISFYISVYDYADDMSYELHDRATKDFTLGLEDEQLVVYMYDYGVLQHGWQHKEPSVDRGTLALKDRKLTFVWDGGVLEGYRSSVCFNMVWLDQTMSKVLDYHDRGIWLRLDDCIANAYMDYSGVDFSPALVEEIKTYLGGEVRVCVCVDPNLTEGFAAEAKYLALLYRMTSTYYTHALHRYVYQDPNDPAQLFICTEIRDCGYRDIASYYEAVMSGQCQPHTETFLVRLDQRAIYRWGSEENLYAQYE